MKEKIILVLIILAILGGAFYWFQIRPSQIRKECAWRAANPIANDNGFNPRQFLKEYMGESYFDQKIYDNCLLKHGLTK